MPISLPPPAAGESVSHRWAGHKPVKPEFDVVIIGGGSAGYAAARTATSLGARTAIVEGAGEMGGLCILRGCMPSKTLLESAHRWHDIQIAGEFALTAKPVKVDMPGIHERKLRLIGRFANYRRKQLLSGKFTLLRGAASFLDAHHLLLSRGRKQELVSASSFIIATGSVLTHVPVPGLWETGCWTSDTALEATTIPKRLAVLGGGIVAVELGQFFARVGSRTTFLQRGPRLASGYDADVSDELARAFKAEEIDVRTGVKLLEVSRSGKAKRIVYEQGRRREELIVDEILYALGREPALAGLKLDQAGLDVKDNCLPVNAQQATAVPHIFAAGDAVGPYEVVHIAIQQGEIAARNAVDFIRGSHQVPLKIDYRLKALVTFTDPEIALVGLTEAEAKKQEIDYLCASYPFNDHGKAEIGGHEFGFVKLMAEKRRGEIIGAQIIGPHASDLIHELIAVMRYHGTVTELAAMPHYHPTLAEIVTYPAEEIAEKLTPHSMTEHALKHL